MGVDRFTDSYIDDVKAKVPISEVIGQSVVWDKEKTLPSRGDYWACCPFHSESSPSFHCEDAKGLYHCFGCGAAGDHVEFLTKSVGLSFPDAIERLAELAGIPLPDGRPRENRQYPAQDRRSAPAADNAAPEQEPPPDTPTGEMKPVKGYRYTDRDGNPLYEVIRYQFVLPDGSFVLDPKTGNPKKTFRQRRMVDGQYVWNLDGIGHTIWRHPQVEQAIADGVTLWLPEGEKDVETLESWGLVGSTNSGGAKNWTPQLAAYFKDADVVILVDNDDVGRAAGEAKAKSLKGIAKRVRLLDFAAHVPGFAPKGDVTDWSNHFGGTAEQLSALIGHLPDWRPAPPQTKFRAVSLVDVRKPEYQHDWLVDDTIELHGVCAMPGMSKAGKSFLAHHMEFCVSLGVPFWGHDVKQGLVIHQAGEGQEGMMKRLEGYLRYHGLESRTDIPLVPMLKKINLFVDDRDTDDLIAECKQWEQFWGQKLRLLTLDTFNKAITGANEISGQDMGKVTNRLERLRDELSCTVMTLQHMDKKGVAQRGHSSLTADVSNVIEVHKLENSRDKVGRPIRTFRIDKNKDGEDNETNRFVLITVPLDPYPGGKERSTCVVGVPSGEDLQNVKDWRLSPNERLALDAMKDATAKYGVDAPATLQIGSKVVSIEHWVAAARDAWPFIEKASENAEQRTARLDKELKAALTPAEKSLRQLGYTGRSNDHRVVWWTGKEQRRKDPIQAPASKPPNLSPGMKEAIDSGVPF
jgi:hypothetical protein